ncbi:zinc-ribbon domain-containing protein, partial [Lactobacillus sp. XV13L]|nr:zinc-ribbon domain-containing protein [Lactobacillus sp. XV13L]
MNETKFCPNCGEQVEGAVEFCPNCGTRLPKAIANRQRSNTDKNIAAPQEAQVPTRQRTANLNKRPPMKKRNKIILTCVGIVIVAFAAFYAWGSNHYQRSNQVSQITAMLKDPRQGLAQYVTSANPNVRVTDTALKPTQEYYAEHYEEADKMADAFKYGDSYGNISLVQEGHYLLFFPKYSLRLRTYS